MPEAEPGVDGTDAAPGANPATPDSEQPTLFSTTDVPTTEAVADGAEAAPPADEWDAPASSNEDAEPAAPDAEPERLEAELEAVEPQPDPSPDPAPDAFATGVLEIVSALDVDEGTAPGGADVPAGAGAAGAVMAIGAVAAEDAETVAAEGAAATEPIAGPPAPDASTEVVVPAVATADDVSPEGAEAPQAEAVPALTPEAAPAAAAEAELPRGRVPWWPFAVYLGLWVGGLAYAAYRLLQVPAGQALYEQILYGYFVLGGLVLTALGPVLIPFVWLLARAGLEKSQRGGLFARAAFWGALSTLLGVAMWWLTIMALDAARLGSPL